MKYLITIFFIYQITSIQGQNKTEQEIKDSIVAKRTQNFNLTQGKWGFLYIDEPFLVEQSEITIGEWLNYIYYKGLDSFPVWTIGKRISKEEKAYLLGVTIDSAILPSKEFIESTGNKYLFEKCEDCKLFTFRSLDGFAHIPVESSIIDTRKKRKKLMNSLLYPIAGISYEQATQFCFWRTAMDSLWWSPTDDSISTKKKIADKVLLPYSYSYIFRLPTPSEFEKYNLEVDSISSCCDSENSNYNYKNAKQICNRKYYTLGAGPINVTYHTNYNKHNKKTGVYHVQGNVAEMTSNKGIAKGGSYFHYAKKSYNNDSISYTKPEIWLGFRCVAIPRKIK